MNDRNRFRVWDNDLNQYITDTFEVAIKNNGELINHKGDPIKNCIVEHCTGLPAAKSYRGTTPEDLLIYQGDIIKPDYGMPKCVVVWHKIGWRLMQLPIEKKCKNTDCPNENGTLCQTYAKHFLQSEIIGNVHEVQG